MINDTKEFLENANPNYVKLFFVERLKDKNTKEISYNILKTTINSDIGQDLIDSALRQVSSTLKREPEYMEYGIAPYSDRNQIEFIKRKEVPYLSQLMNQTSDPKLETFKDDRLKNIFGYIVRIKNGNKTLYLFRKYTPKKLMEVGKIPLIVKGSGFQKLKSSLMALDETYDATFLSNDGEDSTEFLVLIFSRSYFESLFSFVDFYEKEVEKQKETIKEKGFLKNLDELISLCKNDSRMIKKFARILKSGEFKKMKMENIRNVVNQYDLDVKFDDGKLVADKDNIWVVLRILDDDYVNSQITNSKYEARSKVKK